MIEVSIWQQCGEAIGSIVSRQLLYRSAGIGSRGQDFMGEFLMSLRTSLSVRRNKLAKDDEVTGSGYGFEPKSTSLVMTRDALIVATFFV